MQRRCRDQHRPPTLDTSSRADSKLEHFASHYYNPPIRPRYTSVYSEPKVTPQITISSNLTPFHKSSFVVVFDEPFLCSDRLIQKPFTASSTLYSFLHHRKDSVDALHYSECRSLAWSEFQDGTNFSRHSSDTNNINSNIYLSVVIPWFPVPTPIIMLSHTATPTNRNSKEFPHRPRRRAKSLGNHLCHRFPAY